MMVQCRWNEIMENIEPIGDLSHMHEGRKREPAQGTSLRGDALPDQQGSAKRNRCWKNNPSKDRVLEKRGVRPWGTQYDDHPGQDNKQKTIKKDAIEPPERWSPGGERHQPANAKTV